MSEHDLPRPSGHVTPPGRAVPMLPLVLLLAVSAVLAPALAAWGEAGGPDAGTLEQGAFLMAAYVGWPAALFGPAALAAVLAQRHGRTPARAALWFACWAVATWGVVAFGLMTAFVIACDGTCLS